MEKVLKERADKTYIFIYFPLGYGHAINIRYSSTNGCLEFSNSNGGFGKELDGESWDKFSFKNCSLASLYCYKYMREEYNENDYN